MGVERQPFATTSVLNLRRSLWLKSAGTFDAKGQENSSIMGRLATADIKFVVAGLHAPAAIRCNQAKLARGNRDFDCLRFAFVQMNFFKTDQRS